MASKQERNDSKVSAGKECDSDNSLIADFNDNSENKIEPLLKGNTNENGTALQLNSTANLRKSRIKSDDDKNINENEPQTNVFGNSSSSLHNNKNSKQKDKKLAQKYVYK